MSFFKKLKERMFRSSDKIGEGLEALVSEETPASPQSEAKPGILGRLFGATDEPRRMLDDSMLEDLEDRYVKKAEP